MQNENFLSELTRSWSAQPFSNGSLMDKLPRVLSDLHKWGRTVFRFYQEKRFVKQKMTCLKLQSGTITDSRQIEEKKLQEHLNHICNALDETFWHQRSRINWIHDGDKNTHFFHLSSYFKEKEKYHSQSPFA